MTPQELLDHHGIKCEAKFNGVVYPEGREVNQWLVLLTQDVNGVKLTLDYETSKNHRGYIKDGFWVAASDSEIFAFENGYSLRSRIVPIPPSVDEFILGIAGQIESVYGKTHKQFCCNTGFDDDEPLSYELYGDFRSKADALKNAFGVRFVDQLLAVIPF